MTDIEKLRVEIEALRSEVRKLTDMLLAICDALGIRLEAIEREPKR